MPFFSQTAALSASEADPNRQMKLSAMLKYMQDIASTHLDALGYPYERLYGTGQVFLLSKVEIEVLAYPKAQENITLLTRPHPPKGVYFLRETRIEQDDTPMVLSKSAWVLADVTSHKVLRPSAFDWGYTFDEVSFDTAITKQKTKEPDEVPFLGSRPVRFSDLDGNGHINNAVYGDILFDFLPLEITLAAPFKKVFLQYEHEAILGDEIAIHGAPTDDGWYMAGFLGDRRCFSSEIRFFADKKNPAGQK